MKTIEEMSKWNYKTAWKFFTENAFNRYIPESELYIRSLTLVPTEDLRDDENARQKILGNLKKKSLILIDGSSLNGKTTFANRLSKQIKASIVDIDLICADWIEQKLAKATNPIEHFSVLMNIDSLTDVYIMENLEKIIKENSGNGNVILVGCYIEVIYRSIIVRTLGKYFDQVISLYCCAKTFNDIKIMKSKRDKEFASYQETDDNVLNQYIYSKRLLQYEGIMLGFGMTASFITDNTVSDMFV